jgi:Ca2+-binding RTX toxin-like protein
MARIFDERAQAITGEIQISISDAGAKGVPQAVKLADGRVLINWLLDEKPGISGDIRHIESRLLNADGSIADQKVELGTSERFGQEFPSIAKLKSGGIVVSWLEPTNDGSARLAARIYNSDFNPIGGKFIVGTGLSVIDGPVAMTGTSDGSIIFGWGASDASGLNSKIKTAKYDSQGRLLDKSEIPGTGESAFAPRFLGLSNGDFVATWSDEFGVKAAVFRSDGSERIPEFRVSTSVEASSSEISALPNGGFLITWNGATSLRGRYFDSTGTALGAEFKLADGEGIAAPHGSIALNNGEVFFVWTQYEPDEIDPSASSVRGKVVHGPGYQGTSNSDKWQGDSAKNIAYGGSGSDFMAGLSGDDFLVGGSGYDRLLGGRGNDEIVGGVGQDYINGGAGSDTAIYKDETAVTITLANNKGNTGGAKGDVLISVENIVGSNGGNDIIIASAGANRLEGSGGGDSLFGVGGRDSLSGGFGDDFLWGGTGGDSLDGGDGNDWLSGDAGNDILVASKGNDVMDGGTGRDTVSYSSEGRVRVALDYSITSAGSAKGDVLYSIENIRGSRTGNDTLIGNNASNAIWGSGGDDIIQGGVGVDKLAGGSGTDFFRYTNPDQGLDEIADFGFADSFVFEGSTFGFGSYRGDLASGLFVSRSSGNSAVDADCRFVFDRSRNELWYDHDGEGQSEPALIARLMKEFDLSAGDIVIV